MRELAARLLPPSAALPLLLLALHAPFSSFFASPAIVALAHLLGHGVTLGDDIPGSFSGNRRPVYISQFVGTIFLEDHVDPIQKMRSTGANCLSVVFAFVRHLVVINDGNLRIVLAADVGIQKPKLLDQLPGIIPTKHYSLRTEESYIQWIKRFIIFHNKRHPNEMSEVEINQFLSHLAVKKNLAASTQNQALCAIVFLYKHVLNKKNDTRTARDKKMA